MSRHVSTRRPITTDSDPVASTIAVTPTGSKLDQTRITIATHAKATGITIPRLLIRPGMASDAGLGTHAAHAARTGAQYQSALYQSFCV